MQKQEQKGNRTKRLQAIGETRWWLERKSLERLFGSFGKPDNALWIKNDNAVVCHQQRRDNRFEYKCNG